MGQFEAPQSNTKLKKLLGFKEEFNWLMYYPEYELRDGIIQLKVSENENDETITNGAANNAKEVGN